MTRRAAPPPLPAPGRAGALALVLLLGGLVADACAVLLATHALPALLEPSLRRVDATVAAGVLLVGAGAAAWLGTAALVAGACALARAGGRAWGRGESAVRRWAPAVVRRALTVAVVAAVGVGATSGAHATTSTPGVAGDGAGTSAVVVDLGWAPTQETPPAGPATAPPVTGAAPDRSAAVPAVAPPVAPTGDAVPSEPAVVASPAPAPADVPLAPATTPHAEGAVTATPAASAPPRPGTPPDSAAPTAAPGTPAPATVVVQPGDTLWAVTARHLGPGASDAAVAAAWPAWYAANAATVGPDPDLIHPGQVLVVPADADRSTR